MAVSTKTSTMFMIVGSGICFSIIMGYIKNGKRDLDPNLSYVASLVNILNGNNIGNHEKTLWLNLGYWRENCSSYAEAAEALAAAVLEPRYPLKRKETNRSVFIDVGCGLGESLNLWAKKFNADKKKSFGINLSNSEVNIARANNQEMSSRVFVGNACDIKATNFLLDLNKEKDSSVDVIVAVDAAYHFVTRAQFIHEASQLLRPNGYFGAADIVTIGEEEEEEEDSHTMKNSNLFHKINSFLKKQKVFYKRWFVGIIVGIPIENMYNDKQYKKILQRENFEQILFRDVTEHVPMGFEQWGRDKSGSFVIRYVTSFVAFCFRFAELRFVLVSALKSENAKHNVKIGAL